jgi:hypothetical protein
MPLGSFRLNTLSAPPEVAASAKASAATWTAATGTWTIASSASALGGALNGSGVRNGYITVDPADTTWYFSNTKPWTVEMRIWYPGTFGAFENIFGIGTGVDAGGFFIRPKDGPERFTYTLNGDNNDPNSLRSFTNPQHLALVSTGNGNITAYLNGVAEAGGAFSGANTRSFSLGSEGSIANRIDEVRISNSALYTSNFTVPTFPYTNNGANTLAYFPFHTNKLDASGARLQLEITASGNAKISTATSKFGSASALFDGAGDRLDVSNTGNPFNLGTGNFTYECFVNITAIGNGDRHAVFYHDDGCRIEIRRTGANIYPHIYLNNTLADPTDPQITSSQYITTGTWNHIALVRNSNTLTVYVNGVSGGTSATLGATLSSQTALYIGNREDNSLSLNGYLDEMRISNIARYTANFTPPAVAFVNDANTKLLMHANGTNLSTTFLDDSN